MKTSPRPTNPNPPLPAYYLQKAQEDNEPLSRWLTRWLVIFLSILLPLWLLTGCATLSGPGGDARAERMAPEPVGLHPATVKTYTTADRFEAPMPVDTARGW
ncbi:hypothetical protein [Hymenobacter psychrophilus]|uniref:Uncharacterized protein n=1 Tax=Hymenobacter psychrophilus TaxID=651662 RepID=A0A1H3PDJ4_9BACT|nr:hypothetical protein [Hymenobacter psychrophilus]SDY99150.1 hypothetical protein SAMN04488069_1299 [Hymenobacter psychrophilus]